MTGSRGFALVELVVAAVLLLLVAQASWWVVATQARASAHVVQGARALDAARLARHVLTSELRSEGMAGAVEIVAGELRLRAFRGVAVFCEGAGTGWWVNADGLRSLAPDKDSLLLLTRSGAWEPATVVRRRTSDDGRCPVHEGFREERWELDRPAEGPQVARFFERGGYRFSAGAFRTLAGRAWQPLTELLVDDGRSRVEWRGVDGVVVEWHWVSDIPLEGPVTWSSWRVR